MNLREQEYVLAIARHKGIKGASEELFISPPSLSVFLKDLEEREGVILFNRIKKKFIPTPAGQAYLDTAQKMLYLKLQYSNAMVDLKNEVSGTINLGIHTRRTTHLIPIVLTKFQQEYPKVKVSVVDSDSKTMEKMLSNGELDILLGNWPCKEQNLTTVEIYRDQLQLVLAKDHRASKFAKKLVGRDCLWMDLAKLADETFILQHPRQTTRMFTDEAFRYAGVEPKKSLIIENMETATQLAALGYGAAFNVKSYLGRMNYHVPFDQYLVGDPNFYISIFIAYNTDAYIPNYTRAFIQLLKENFI